jgi:metallo-beta-lactamase family protein
MTRRLRSCSARGAIPSTFPGCTSRARRKSPSRSTASAAVLSSWQHNLWREDSSVVFVGYAARGTLARIIIDGAKQVRLFGEEIPVRANIHTINGFSAHADQAELLAWHQRIGASALTFLVHGEQETMRHFAGHLKNTRVEMPALHQEFEL